MARRRNTGDEDLRRLERRVLAGDESAYERYVREAHRRGLDPDETELNLLRKVDDPQEFLASETGEDARRLIENKAESFLDAHANEEAARRWSSGDDNEARWEVAYFGDAVAVNGELLRDGFGEPARPAPVGQPRPDELDTTPPANFVEDNRGGRVPGGSEHEFEVEHLAQEVTEALKLEGESLRTAVQRVIAEKFGSWSGRPREWNQIDLVYWNSSDGHTVTYHLAERETCADCGVEGTINEGRDSELERYADVRRASEISDPFLCGACYERREGEVECAQCWKVGDPSEGFYDDPVFAGIVLCDSCYDKKYPNDDAVREWRRGMGQEDEDQS